MTASTNFLTSVTNNGRGQAVIALAEQKQDGIARLISHQLIPMDMLPELIEQLQIMATAHGQRAANPRWAN